VKANEANDHHAGRRLHFPFPYGSFFSFVSWSFSTITLYRSRVMEGVQKATEKDNTHKKTAQIDSKTKRSFFTRCIMYGRKKMAARHTSVEEGWDGGEGLGCESIRL
jgi:hypothetical protein